MEIEELYKELINVKLEAIKQQQEGFYNQQERLISHVESEQRVTGNISKRVSEVEFHLRDIVEKINKHDKILFNEGKGLIWRVGNFERMGDTKKDLARFWVQLIISVGAIIISLIAIFKS